MPSISLNYILQIFAFRKGSCIFSVYYHTLFWNLTISYDNITPTRALAVPPNCYYWRQKIKKCSLNVVANHDVSTMFPENRSSILIHEKGDAQTGYTERILILRVHLISFLGVKACKDWKL
jgi:hypothetical protein